MWNPFGHTTDIDAQEAAEERDQLFRKNPPECGVGDRVLIAGRHRSRTEITIVEASKTAVAYNKTDYSYKESEEVNTKIWIDRHMVVEVIERVPATVERAVREVREASSNEAFDNVPSVTQGRDNTTASDGGRLG